MLQKISLLTFLLFIVFISGAQTVYINNVSMKYHLETCKKVTNKYFAVSLKEALNINYKACSECHPPEKIYDETSSTVTLTDSVAEIITIDSTKELRLTEYKNLYDKGLIDEKEYAKLKSNILSLNNIPKKQVNVINKDELEILKNSFKIKVITGSVLFGAGLGLIGTGAYYKKNKFPDINDYIKNNTVNTSKFNSDVKQYKKNYLLLFSSGAVLSGIGVVLDILGLYDKTVYNNKANTVSLGLAKENIGISLCFK